MREFNAEDGSAWEALTLDAVVAHGRRGAVLAFRPVGEPDAEPLRTNITFNSHEAGTAAVRALGEMELRRRLTLARAALGIP